jgi:hypothetical protein
MRGGGGPHTRRKSTAPSRIERVAKDPMRRAKKRVDLAHPRRRWKPSSSACARGSVKARDEFSEFRIANAQAIWRAIVDRIPALSRAIPVSFYPPCAHECRRMPSRVRAWPRDSAPGRDCTPRDTALLGKGRGKTCRTGVGTCGGIGSPSSVSRLKTASRSSRLPFLLCQTANGRILTSILPFHTFPLCVFVDCASGGNGPSKYAFS